MRRDERVVVDSCRSRESTSTSSKKSETKKNYRTTSRDEAASIGTTTRTSSESVRIRKDDEDFDGTLLWMKGEGENENVVAGRVRQYDVEEEGPAAVGSEVVEALPAASRCTAKADIDVVVVEEENFADELIVERTKDLVWRLTKKGTTYPCYTPLKTQLVKEYGTKAFEKNKGTVQRILLEACASLVL